MTTKDTLHALIDRLPEETLPEIEHLLRLHADPVYRALMEAPEDDEPLTDEDLAAMAEADAEIERGDVASLETVRARYARPS